LCKGNNFTANDGGPGIQKWAGAYDLHYEIQKNEKICFRKAQANRSK